MAKLVFDKAKMLELGDGSIKVFCEKFNFKRGSLYRMMDSTRKVQGTYAHAASLELIKLGVAKWVNTESSSSHQ